MAPKSPDDKGRQGRGGDRPKRAAKRQVPKKHTAKKSSAKKSAAKKHGAKERVDPRRGGPRRRPARTREGDAGATPRRAHGKASSGRDAGDPREELRRLAGSAGERAYGRLMEAAEAYQADRYRDARRLLEPLRDRYPDALSVRELLGLTYYRMGRYRDALKELGVFVERTGTTDQHPVLMDCHRAQGADAEVEELWDELRRVSPSGEVVTEGRIVMAGMLADRGRLGDAIRLLAKGPVEPKAVRPHHLRLWYALADLEERAGNLPRARALFEQIRRREADFADVAERLAALG